MGLSSIRKVRVGANSHYTTIMINKVKQIHQFRYALYGEPFSTLIVGEYESGEHLASTPFSFLFNCSWKVEHKCCNCAQAVSFGLGSQSANSDVRTHQFGYLCSKYYLEDFLKVFPQLFSSTELKEWEGKLFVISDNIFEPDYPITSSIEPMLYNCPVCNADFLARIRIGYPLLPEKNMPGGMLGKIFIDEIVYVKVDGDKHFIDLIEENKVIAR
jgi:hypothetical protein